MAYTPLFKRVRTSEKTGEQIRKIQADFEKLWFPINKALPSNAEKTLGMRRLQEACMWLTRSICVSQEQGVDEPKPKE